MSQDDKCYGKGRVNPSLGAFANLNMVVRESFMEKVVFEQNLTVGEGVSWEDIWKNSKAGVGKGRYKDLRQSMCGLFGQQPGGQCGWSSGKGLLMTWGLNVCRPL